ncbi:hypothetical protein ACFFTM_16920 [Pseudoduganella plicata]|uniref:Uncharacterized protein n=1 Tax=Pseudoduganella plicata TaxID=321984 RepID=A0A4P7BL41_9BURK|nr:hypothetical protein [Pseudoduganella plicata]QBQ38937.1 hypothetical protein E1742_24365 [Pseudoduganella plicata]GGY85906.1 hypothetical protein GCM10007388_18720 [Pseudoduganella plicata]
MQPDALITLRFLSSEEGGRLQPAGGRTFGCPMIIDGEGYDCRLLLDGLVLQPGKLYEVPVKFLRRDYADERLHVGTPITLWEGKTIASGTISRVYPGPQAARLVPQA